MEKQNELLLPLYQCHKKVRAAQVIAMSSLPLGEARLSLLIPRKNQQEENATKHVKVDYAWLTRNPALEVGGYFVEYQDGYTAFSPKAPFEDGYTLVSDMVQPLGDEATSGEMQEIDAEFTAWWRRACAADGFPGADCVSPEMVARAAYHAALCGGFGCRPKIGAVEDQIKVQCSDGNWNHDQYMHGMANGLICAVATFKGQEPAYLSAPTDGYLCDRATAGAIGTGAGPEEAQTGNALINEQIATAAPPVDNDHVAEGCEQFAGSAAPDTAPTADTAQIEEGSEVDGGNDNHDPEA